MAESASRSSSGRPTDKAENSSRAVMACCSGAHDTVDFTVSDHAMERFRGTCVGVNSRTRGLSVNQHAGDFALGGRGTVVDSCGSGNLCAEGTARSSSAADGTRLALLSDMNDRSLQLTFGGRGTWSPTNSSHVVTAGQPNCQHPGAGGVASVLWCSASYSRAISFPLPGSFPTRGK